MILQFKHFSWNYFPHVYGSVKMLNARNANLSGLVYHEQVQVFRGMAKEFGYVAEYVVDRLQFIGRLRGSKIQFRFDVS